MNTSNRLENICIHIYTPLICGPNIHLITIIEIVEWRKLINKFSQTFFGLEGDREKIKIESETEIQTIWNLILF